MFRFALLTLAVLLWIAPAARAADPIALRTLRSFDFEERDRGNVEDTPAGWLKVEGPGLPKYVGGRFDETVAANGHASFRFDLNGGSVLYRYPAGRLPVAPGATCRLTAMVRTTPLAGARARITACFADADGHPIAASRRRITPPANAPGDDAFHPIAIDLPVADDAAASLVLELGLLQPALLAADDDAVAAAGPGDRPLYVEDIKGSAWFDDLRIAQVPQVDLSTGEPTNVFYPGDPIALRVRVRDTIVGDLTADVRVVDVDGHGVFQRTGSLAAAAGQRDTGEARGAIPLPAGLPPGWYRATLAVRSGGQTIGEHALSFVRLVDPPATPRRDARLGLAATALRPRDWTLLPDLADRLAAGRFKVAVWSDRFAAEDDTAGATDLALNRLARKNVAITACLVAPSPALARLLPAPSWSALTKVDQKSWEPMLAYLASRFGSGTTGWQFGDDNAADAISRDPALRTAYDRLADVMQTFTGARDLALPWPAWFDVDAPHADAPLALSVPADVLPEQLALYIDELRAKQPKRSVALSLAPISRDRYGRPMQERDLALRVVAALAAGADRVDLPMPVAVSTPAADGPARLDPEPLLPVQHTLFATLAGARFVGKASLGEDVDGYCFNRDGQGVVFVTRRGGPSETANVPTKTYDITLGSNVRRLDLNGIASSLPRSAAPGHADDTALSVGAMPFFVTDVDLPLVMLRASIGLDRPVVESSNLPHGRTLTFRNDFDGPITGTLRLIGPPGWSVTLGTQSFSLQPGETFKSPVQLTFPTSVPAGPTALLADLRIEGRQDRRLLLPVALRVGLADVGLQSFAVRVGGDVIVQQVITNYGNAPISYTAFVSIPGRPRQERIISELAPGRSTVRKYRIPAPDVGVKLCRSGLKELEGRRMLNAEVPID